MHVCALRWPDNNRGVCDNLFVKEPNATGKIEQFVKPSNASQRKKRTSFAVRYRNKNGITFWLNAKLTPLPEKQGMILSLLLFT
mmetsp:Transcript_40514/g.85035  ORF Transcript_40514/g.85035 Transcript_40514/m.85035 type:complete len:84 (-) Transcript_40514:1071-1322(-)